MTKLTFKVKQKVNKIITTGTGRNEDKLKDIPGTMSLLVYQLLAECKFHFKSWTQLL